MNRFLYLLENIDRRVIYLFVVGALLWPLLSKKPLRPAPMRSADSFFQVIESHTPKAGEIALISIDWGPSTIAENGSQTKVLIEHLFRKNIPFAVISITPYAAPFLESLPKEIAATLTDLPREYGKHWVNLGYQPNPTISIQGIAKSENLIQTLKTDASGTPLSEIPVMQGVRTLENIPLFVQVTGLVGTFNTWLQFLQRGEFRPIFLHGCTSITIPEAHIYLASGQIKGLYEGLAGAAAYEWLMSERFPGRAVGDALIQNTSLAIAQLLIITLIIIGNAGRLLRMITGRSQ